MDNDKDPVVEIDWLCDNCKDNTSWLTEYVLAEEGTFKVTDWDWLWGLLLVNNVLSTLLNDREALGLTDSESLSETLVDIDALELQDADTLLETAVEK